MEPPKEDMGTRWKSRNKRIVKCGAYRKLRGRQDVGIQDTGDQNGES